jgi:hypothetical protein
VSQPHHMPYWTVRLLALLGLTDLLCPMPQAQAQPQKPNILVIMGGDIGLWNLSAWNHGMLGFRTPNIDRIAHEGALFTASPKNRRNSVR